jgi:NACHT domain
MKDPHQKPIKIEKGPPEGGPFREAWATLRLPFIRTFWHARARWLLHRGVIHARRWRNPPVIMLLLFILWFMAIVLTLWLTRAIVTVVLFHNKSVTTSGGLAGWRWGSFNPDGVCQQVNTSCDAINSVLMPVLLVATSTVIFLAWRLFRVRRFYRHKATTEANSFVQTAGSLMDEVVGRDHLCDALMNNLRDRKTRRPHVIVGGIGVGKTALLVHLTERLAAIGAVPVPVRLRDVQQEKDLDFNNLARKRFSELVEPIVGSNAEQDRAWRWLREQAGRVVVLADGLEEALSGRRMAGQRDNLIRTAIRKAREQGLPLVIASRPHDPLRAMQAAITWLEPLSDEAALRYISRGGSWRSDPTLLDRVVEAAKVVESPLYLQIAKDLHSKDLLEPLWAGVNAGDLAVQDRWTLRQDLLRTWLNALVDGKIHAELPIDPDTRQAVVEYMSALACIGLASDSATIALRDLDPFLGAEWKRIRGRVNQQLPANRVDQQLPANQDWRDCVARYLGRRMSALQEPVDGQDKTTFLRIASSRRTKMLPPGPYMDVRLAATWGARMGLVQESGTTDSDSGSMVHFQHSIIQAYLGSRFLPAIMSDPASSEESPAMPGSQSPSPWRRRLAMNAMTLQLHGESRAKKILSDALPDSGRELLIALVLHSRSLDGRCTCAERDGPRGQPCPTHLMCEVLGEAASHYLDAAKKALSRAYTPLREALDNYQSYDKQNGFSLRALECFGAAVNIATEDDTFDLNSLVRKAKDEWPSIGLGEDPIRLREAKITMVQQCGAAARRMARRNSDGSIYRIISDIGCIEPDYHVRSEIATQVGTGGVEAFNMLDNIISSRERIVNSDRPLDRSKDKPKTQMPGDKRSPPRIQDDRQRNASLQESQRQRQRGERKRADEEAQDERGRWYHSSMRAWLLPMLVDSSVTTGHSGSPWHDLESLVSDATKGTELRVPGRPGEAPLSNGERYGSGLALAQGFKYAANRRLNPQSNQEGREFLIKQAEELLKRSNFWYTRLTLLQALTLWALPDDVTGPHQIRGKGADPRDQVKGWLALREGQREHPLVKAGGKLAVRALQTRRPERFLWIDDTDMASRIGTEVSAPGAPRFHNLWIPPSTGWSSLDPAAQQLLADVLLLMVLGERGYRPKDLFRVLERVSESPKLPSCLNRDRSRLEPVRAVDAGAQPGDKCADDCGMKMCPYPGKAEKGLRLEFNEIFCLHQRDMLRAWQPRSWRYLRFRRESPWQHKVPVAGMRRFWDEMGERARDVSREDSGTARTQVRA